tara:strand:+ start:98 stop:724 length:627 start_codon:yes stop_codon:yes gene_type:complete
MTIKLVQKQFLKASREFEIDNDVINVRIKTLFKEEKITVILTSLNPDPVINGTLLEFHSRVQSGPTLSLLLNKPNPEKFNNFVNELKRQAREEFNSFAGLKSGSKLDRMAGNVYEEPPEFDTPVKKVSGKSVCVESIDISIQMLNQYLDVKDLGPLIFALEALKKDLKNESCFSQLVNAFADLGPLQGAVLTYAPYVNFLLTDDPLES